METVGEYFKAKLGVELQDPQGQLNACPIDSEVGDHVVEVIDLTALYLNVRHISDATRLVRRSQQVIGKLGAKYTSVVPLAQQVCLCLMYS